MGCGGSKTTDGTDGGTQAAQRNATNRNSPNKVTNANNNNINKNNNANKARSQPYPQSKYAANSQNGSANGDVFPEPNDKGYKRRIRASLIKATAGTDIEGLESALAKAELNRLEDGGDLTRAYDRLQFLKTKRSLRDAIRRRHVGVLEKTIADARASPYAGQLGPQIAVAERQLEHLRELNEYSHDILAMDQSTISELHSYHRPPACVHDVMAATYMLLGHDESTLRDWSYLQSMAGKVGRDSLIHQVRDFDSSNVDDRTAGRVREILNYHELSEVRVASNGAATFHVWASNIVDKIQKDSAQENDRTSQGEQGRQRQQPQKQQQQQQKQQQQQQKQQQQQQQQQQHQQADTKTGDTPKGRKR